MKNNILLNLDNPAQLERLYRTDKPAFRSAFNALYPEIKDRNAVGFWNERLNYTNEEVSAGNTKDLIFIILAALGAGIIAKLPAILNINDEFFFSRNIGFIVLPALSAFFAWKNKIPATRLAAIAGLTVLSAVFINLRPNVPNSDTLILSSIHLVLFLWALLGISFVGGVENKDQKRLSFLKYNGDLIVMTALIVIAGGIMTAMTIGLFKLIGYDIEKFYFQNIVVFGLPAAPILATYLIQTNPQLVGRVSPVIARIFSPIVFVMLVIYVVAILYSRKNPYNDREFLLIFNALLIGVMAIIFFSVAESAKTRKSPLELMILFLLSIVTVIVNGIALSAIVLRIATWGISPNRAAVLGGNILILINLILITRQLYLALLEKRRIENVGNTIARYLPVYVIWTVIVTFIFPLLFSGK